MDCHVIIEWTSPAKDGLEALPAKPKKGLFEKINSLQSSDPRVAGKPLVGPFMGYRRVTYGRYRAIFSVQEEHLASGDVLLRIKVVVVAVGIRKERDKNDVYQVAKKLLKLGLIPSKEEKEKSKED